MTNRDRKLQERIGYRFRKVMELKNPPKVHFTVGVASNSKTLYTLCSLQHSKPQPQTTTNHEPKIFLHLPQHLPNHPISPMRRLVLRATVACPCTLSDVAVYASTVSRAPGFFSCQLGGFLKLKLGYLKPQLNYFKRKLAKYCLI